MYLISDSCNKEAVIRWCMNKMNVYFNVFFLNYLKEKSMYLNYNELIKITFKYLNKWNGTAKIIRYLNYYYTLKCMH